MMLPKRYSIEVKVGTTILLYSLLQFLIMGLGVLTLGLNCATIGNRLKCVLTQSLDMLCIIIILIRQLIFRTGAGNERFQKGCI